MNNRKNKNRKKNAAPILPTTHIPNTPAVHPGADGLYPNGKVMTDAQIASIERVLKNEKGSFRYSKWFFKKPENRIDIGNHGGVLRIKNPQTNTYDIYAVVRDPETEKAINLGEGSYGKIKIVQNLRTGERFVIKVAIKDSPEARAEFEKEAYWMKELDSGFAAVLPKKGGTGINNNKICLFQPLIPGKELQKVLKQGTLTTSERFELMLQAFQQIQKMHDKNILNKDIKPENMMYDRASGKLKIIDLGTAQRIGTTGPIIGSPAYMAPETLANKFTKKSDVFALGRTLQEVFGISADLVWMGKKNINYFGNEDPTAKQSLSPEYREAMIDLANRLVDQNRKNRINLPAAIKIFEAIKKQYENEHKAEIVPTTPIEKNNKVATTPILATEKTIQQPIPKSQDDLTATIRMPVANNIDALPNHLSGNILSSDDARVFNNLLDKLADKSNSPQTKHNIHELLKRAETLEFTKEISPAKQDTAIKVLTSIIERDPFLTMISLDNNNYNYSQAAKFVSAFTVNDSIKKIEIGGDFGGIEGVIHLLEEMAKKHSNAPRITCNNVFSEEDLFDVNGKPNNLALKLLQLRKDYPKPVSFGNDGNILMNLADRRAPLPEKMKDAATQVMPKAAKRKQPERMEIIEDIEVDSEDEIKIQSSPPPKNNADIDIAYLANNRLTGVVESVEQLQRFERLLGHLNNPDIKKTDKDKISNVLNKINMLSLAKIAITTEQDGLLIAKTLVSILEKNPQITALNIPWNQFSESQGNIIAKAFENEAISKRIDFIAISGNSKSATDWTKPLIALLENVEKNPKSKLRITSLETIDIPPITATRERLVDEDGDLTAYADFLLKMKVKYPGIIKFSKDMEKYFSQSRDNLPEEKLPSPVSSVNATRENARNHDDTSQPAKKKPAAIQPNISRLEATTMIAVAVEALELTPNFDTDYLAPGNSKKIQEHTEYAQHCIQNLINGAVGLRRIEILSSAKKPSINVQELLSILDKLEALSQDLEDAYRHKRNPTEITALLAEKNGVLEKALAIAGNKVPQQKKTIDEKAAPPLSEEVGSVLPDEEKTSVIQPLFNYQSLNIEIPTDNLPPIDIMASEEPEPLSSVDDDAKANKNEVHEDLDDPVIGQESLSYSSTQSSVQSSVFDDGHLEADDEEAYDDRHDPASRRESVISSNSYSSTQSSVSDHRDFEVDSNGMHDNDAMDAEDLKSRIAQTLTNLSRISYGQYVTPATSTRATENTKEWMQSVLDDIQSLQAQQGRDHPDADDTSALLAQTETLYNTMLRMENLLHNLDDINRTDGNPTNIIAAIKQAFIFKQNNIKSAEKLLDTLSEPKNDNESQHDASVEDLRETIEKLVIELKVISEDDFQDNRVRASNKTSSLVQELITTIEELKTSLARENLPAEAADNLLSAVIQLKKSTDRLNNLCNNPSERPDVIELAIKQALVFKDNGMSMISRLVDKELIHSSNDARSRTSSLSRPASQSYLSDAEHSEIAYHGHYDASRSDSPSLSSANDRRREPSSNNSSASIVSASLASESGSAVESSVSLSAADDADMARYEEELSYSRYSNDSEESDAEMDDEEDLDYSSSREPSRSESASMLSENNRLPEPSASQSENSRASRFSHERSQSISSSRHSMFSRSSSVKAASQKLLEVADLPTLTELPTQFKLAETIVALLKDSKFYNPIEADEETLDDNKLIACVAPASDGGFYNIYHPADLIKFYQTSNKDKDNLSTFKDMNSGETVSIKSVFQITAKQLKDYALKASSGMSPEIPRQSTGGSSLK
jgi:serine/threonine protein kinase